MDTYGDVTVDIQDSIALVEICRPPHNYFDEGLITDLVHVFTELDNSPKCLASVLASKGKSFCAGADFSTTGTPQETSEGVGRLYQQATLLFKIQKPVICAIEGATIGGGLGLALFPDFRVSCPESRFAANFTKVGTHPGFGLTFTLPRLIGVQKAALLLLTGRRIDGTTAHDWGLIDILAEKDRVRATALDLAIEIAENAPLAVKSTRATLRDSLSDSVKKHIRRELEEQTWLFSTADFAEGLLAVSERRKGNFQSR